MKRKRRNPKLIFRLAELRKERGLTLDDLAQNPKLSRSGLGDLETGRNAMPSDETLLALCQELRIRPGDLIDLA